MALKLNDGQRLTGLLELCGHYQDGSSQIVKLFDDDATGDYHVNVENFGNNKKRFIGMSYRDAIDQAIEANPDALEQAMNCPAAKPDPDGLRFRVLMHLLTIADGDGSTLTGGQLEALGRLDMSDANTPAEFAADLDSIIADKLVDVQ